MQIFWEKKKGQIFLIFVIFYKRKVPCLLKPSLWTSASSYFDFVCFRQCRRHWDTLSLYFSHYVQWKLLSRWFKSDVFQPHFGADSRRERRYPYIKGCNSGTSQKILWEQIVTCSEHSKEHFKTNLAEYWWLGGGGCTVGQVTSWTTPCDRIMYSLRRIWFEWVQNLRLY